MSKKVITCGCAVLHLDHQPGEPTMFDKAYEGVKHLFTRKPANTEPSRASQKSRLDLRHSHA